MQENNQTFNSYYYRMNYKEIEMEWMKEILRDKEEEIKKLKAENRKLENKIYKLWTRIYQNIDGEKREEYQEYCKRNKL